ncbi:hypothetical protein [Acrocarpospora macrocephala]|uniref:hypothetical protein n=1 Tax=Acrocarpospora macrocephala TaxID=150177 RepID=UPI0012D2F8D8|nr:hypothetical protein [Acrocarpospora macrocephala]
MNLAYRVQIPQVNRHDPGLAGGAASGNRTAATRRLGATVQSTLPDEPNGIWGRDASANHDHEDAAQRSGRISQWDDVDRQMRADRQCGLNETNLFSVADVNCPTTCCAGT